MNKKHFEKRVLKIRSVTEFKNGQKTVEGLEKNIARP